MLVKYIQKIRHFGFYINNVKSGQLKINKWLKRFMLNTNTQVSIIVQNGDGVWFVILVRWNLFLFKGNFLGLNKDFSEKV